MTARDNWTALADYLEKHNELLGVESVSEVALRPGEGGRRFECGFCKESFLLTTEACAMLDRLKALVEQRKAGA